ncbi:hypothetical protein [Streptomyces abikoensis]
MIAEHLQRAHASVLDAHMAVAAWRLARSMPDRTGSSPEFPSPSPAADAGSPTGPFQAVGAVPRHEVAETALRAAARAVHPGSGHEVPAGVTVTWRAAAAEAVNASSIDVLPMPSTPSGPRVDEWRVHAGEAVVATVRMHGKPDAHELGTWAGRPVFRFPPDPRPVARTRVNRLSADDLDALARGDIARLLGPAFDQDGVPPQALPEPWMVQWLAEVGIEPGAGRHWQAVLRAALRPVVQDPAEPAWPWPALAAMEALRVHAIHQGLHLCVPGARAVPLPGNTCLVEVLDADALGRHPAELEVEVTECGMVPRPYVVGDCRLIVQGRPAARLRQMAIALHEAPGMELGAYAHRRTHRKNPDGTWAVAHEWHLAHAAEGDSSLSITHRLENTPDATVRPRLPRGDMLMISRMAEADGDWRQYRPGNRGTFEYDMPDNPWYARENNGTVPQMALMEIALQPGGMLSGNLGIAGEYPGQALSGRNLEGRACLLRPLDPRGTTVRQLVTLRSHTDLLGGIMHRYDFALHSGGEPFYTGEAVNVFLTAKLMAEQKGLDDGRYVPPWLDRDPAHHDGALRRDLRDDRRLGRGRLALLEDTVIVPRGGDHGVGYALCTTPVRDDDWLFDHHFANDPVLPGSFGIQMLYQAVHAYALVTGLTDHIEQPRSAIATGEELRWSYRGQILREHRLIRGEVHIRDVRPTADQVVVRADGSVWRDDLRIYQAHNIAVAIRSATPAERESEG